MRTDNLKDSAISSLFWKLFERGGNAVVQMVVQVVMARLLAPEQFGMLAIMLVFVNLGNVIVQSGLNTALIQAPDATEDDCSTVFWFSLAVSLALYAAVFLSAPGIAAFYAMPGLVWPLRALSLLLVVNAYNSIQIAVITRDLELRKVFNATVASSLASAAIGIGCALAGAGVWALVFQQLSYQAVSCLVHAAQISWRPRAVFDVARARALLSFGWKLLASGLLDQGYQSLSDLLIGRVFSPGQLGLVSQGKKYPAAIGSMLDGAIQPVMLSAVSRVQDDVPRVRSLVRRGLKTSTFLLVPSMALFAVAAPSLVPALLGPQWSECVPFMQVYCLVYALLPIHTTNLPALNGMGRSDLFLRLELVKKAIGVAWILIAAFVVGDVYILVLGYLATGVFSTFINALPNRRVIGYPYGDQLRDITPAALLTAAASAVAALVVPATGLAGLPLVLAQAAAFALVYLALAAAFRVEALMYLVGTVRGFISSR